MATIDVAPGPDAPVSAAAATAEPGDVIELAAGTYPERVIIERSGELGRPITLRAARGARVVLQGDPELKHGLQFDAFGAEGVSRWVVEGIEITGYASHGINALPGCHHLTLRDVSARCQGNKGVGVLIAKGVRGVAIERSQLLDNGQRGVRALDPKTDVRYVDLQVQ